MEVERLRGAFALAEYQSHVVRLEVSTCRNDENWSWYICEADHTVIRRSEAGHLISTEQGAMRAVALAARKMGVRLPDRGLEWQELG